MAGPFVNLACTAALVLTGQSEEDVFGGAAVDHASLEKQAMLRRIAEDKVKTDFFLREETSILDGLDDIDRGLALRRKTLKTLAADTRSVEKEIVRADAKLKEKTGVLDAMRARIGKRIAAMVRLRETPLTDLLARTGSMFEKRLLRDRLRIVAAHDASLIADTKRAAGAAEALSRELRERRDAYTRAKAETEAEIEATFALKEQRAALLRAIRNERRMVERLSKEIAAAAKKLDREKGVVRGLLPAPPRAPGGFARQRGRLPWPLAGKVEVPFGKRVDPDSGMVMAHNGIDVRAPHGEPVRAIFDGEIAHAARVDGFGNVAIVAHDGGWYSIYAHLASLALQAGTAVAQGDAVGVAGETDSNKGPYLYMEIRQRDRAVDPLGWLAP